MQVEQEDNLSPGMLRPITAVQRFTGTFCVSLTTHDGFLRNTSATSLLGLCESSEVDWLLLAPCVGVREVSVRSSPAQPTARRPVLHLPDLGFRPKGGEFTGVEEAELLSSP